MRCYGIEPRYMGEAHFVSQSFCVEVKRKRDWPPSGFVNTALELEPTPRPWHKQFTTVGYCWIVGLASTPVVLTSPHSCSQWRCRPVGKLWSGSKHGSHFQSLGEIESSRSRGPNVSGGVILPVVLSGIVVSACRRSGTSSVMDGWMDGWIDGRKETWMATNSSK